jgi:hypothetical protein
LLESLTTLTGEDNLVGSAGEFGLLFAFLANQPNASRHQTAGKADEHDEQSSFSVQLSDMKLMMVDKRLPAQWDTWPKLAADWVRVTVHIAASAARAHLRR